MEGKRGGGFVEGGKEDKVKNKGESQRGKGKEGKDIEYSNRKLWIEGKE